jgi:ribosomal-protein-alanine N-acetyltransferase
MEPLKIRRMRVDDIDEVWKIEQDLFTMPWPKTIFLYEVSDDRNSYPIVGILDEAITAYAIGWFVGDELHIGNIAVARGKQGAGLGTRLLEEMLCEGARRGSEYATLEVRASNVRAINLYRRYGFRGVAMRERYYADTGEDALVMLAEIGGKDRSEGESC